MDPMSLIMLGLIGLLIIFMVRNGRKRRAQMSSLQQGMVPGAEVMLQSGIFGIFVEEDEEDPNRITIQSGDSMLVVHRNAIGNVVTAVDEPEEEIGEQLAPDDDPSFGEHLDLPDTDESTDLPDAPQPPKSDEN